MNRSITVFSFSGIYDHESFYLEDKGSFIGLSKVPGTNCMCDDEAVLAIEKVFADNGVTAEGIHFFDSGNYHYMSYLFTKMIKKPFSLVVLDHHPDMQPPMFGDILSCGGWVQKVIENDPNVRDIHIIGADRKLIGQLDKEAASRVSFYDTRDVFDKNGAVKLPATEHPVFLSVDKDVVLRSELITNWDQGEMSTEELLSFVSEICRRRDIIGVDICGECGTEEESGFLDAVKGNDELNKRLIETILAEIK